MSGGLSRSESDRSSGRLIRCAHALGIKNILALTGDPIKAGDYPKARAVFDLEAVRLIEDRQQISIRV